MSLISAEPRELEIEFDSISQGLNRLKRSSRIFPKAFTIMQIKHLYLHTNQLEKQRTFYAELMNLPIVKETDSVITFQIGASQLTFQHKENSTPYHFAINIPANKEKEALSWLKERVEILKYEGNEIQDFVSWNAKAMYFYDEDKNIVELIARKNLDNTSDEPFDQNGWLEVSEIGMPVDNIETAYNWLHEKFKLEIFSGSFENFCAIGGEQGLFICIDKNKRKWFPLQDEAYSSEFSIEFEHEGEIFDMLFREEG